MNADRAWLADGGEMGALVRAHDWGATPLGPIGDWPRALRIVVRIVLGSRHPMFLFWGDQHIGLYNDAYRETMGPERHPGALGRPGREVWAEIWDVIGPQIEQVMAGGEATWHEDALVPVTRHGRREDVWWTYGYSAVDDPDSRAGVGGVLVICNDVTREHLAREALRDSEERTRLALAAAGGIGTWDWDVRADLIRADAQFAQLYRVDVAWARQGAPFAEFVRHIHPDDLATLEPAVARALRTGEDFSSEYRLLQEDGSVRWVAARGRCQHDSDGAPRRFTGVAFDVTQRRQIESDLRASEARFRAAFDAVRGVLWTNNGAGEMRGEQPGWAALTGQSREEYQGYGWSSAVHPEDAQRTIDAWNDAVRRRAPFVFEHRVRRQDGAWRDFSIRAVPTMRADGSVREWIGVHTDVTEEHAARRRLREMNVLLEQRVAERTSERDKLWDLSEDLLVTADYEGRLLRVSPSWTQLLGHSETVLLTRPYGEFVHADDFGEVMRALLEMRASNRPARFENRVLAADGSWRWLAWRLAPDPDGRRLTGIGRDVTELRAREAELEIAQEALRQSQKMEAVGQLTGGLAHDFNNLLTGVTGSLELLQARIAQGRTGEAERYIVAAQGAARRAAALTHRLLAFSRRQTLEPRATDVNRLVIGMEDLLRRTMGPAVQVEVVVAGGLWTTLVDPNQLENALLNLAINARDAMPDGGRLTIETANKWLDAPAARARELPVGQYVALSVSDSGTGMTAEVIARAFDPFFTTKPIGMGTGLGLSMIYGFVRQSGGQVRIYSEPDQGTTLTLYLPRHAGPAEAVEPASESVRETSSARAETVLVVDDESTVRMLVSEVLEEAGYTALEASDGAAGLGILDSGRRIDLLVTDVGLPGGINGRQLADAGRRLRPALKVLFITGYAENAVLSHGHLDPGMHVLTKPFAMAALAARITELMLGS